MSDPGLLEITMTNRLNGKVAIVVGAAARGEGVGNGSAVARLFAQEGATVVLVNRTEERATRLHDEIVREGGAASVFAADVTDEADVEKVFAHCISAFGRVHILHNNVGSVMPCPLENLTLEHWNDTIRINLTSAVLCCKHAIPLMKKNDGGSIINVSATPAEFGMATEGVGLAGYSASKAGLEGLTRAIAGEYAADGIRANCLVVGMVWTPMVSGLGEAAREGRRLGVPLRTEGTGWDVAHAALYLASDEARWITGHMLPVDGGVGVVRPMPHAVRQ
jgi:NAD(P)-dependent dehydrogenase (short-subunit alcohol dehydrogenase family)